MMADESIKAGLGVQQKAKRVIEALHADGMLVGQAANRPAPPRPLDDGAGEFFQMFIAAGNNPSAVEVEHARGSRNDLNQLFKGVMHANPGGWAYSEGWSALIACYARVMDADTRLREMATIRTRLTALEQKTGLALLDLDSDGVRASVGGLGGALMLVGVAGLLLRRRKAARSGDAAED